jgi:Ca2+-binding RTX toxin-like protein
MANLVKNRGRVIALSVTSTLLATAPMILLEQSAWATHGPPHTCQGRTVTQVSLNQTSNGDDAVLGTTLVDVVATGKGLDIAKLGAGADYLCGNEDGDGRPDIGLEGGTYGDVINGGQGTDWIFGDPGADTIYGGDARDMIGAGDDADYVEGNLGQDIINGNAGNDTLKGNEDADQVYDGTGSDIVQGNAPSSGNPGDTFYRCDTNNTASGFETVVGPSDVYCVN